MEGALARRVRAGAGGERRGRAVDADVPNGRRGAKDEASKDPGRGAADPAPRPPSSSDRERPIGIGDDGNPFEEDDGSAVPRLWSILAPSGADDGVDEGAGSDTARPKHSPPPEMVEDIGEDALSKPNRDVPPRKPAPGRVSFRALMTA